MGIISFNAATARCDQGIAVLLSGVMRIRGFLARSLRLGVLAVFLLLIFACSFQLMACMQNVQMLLLGVLYDKVCI